MTLHATEGLSGVSKIRKHTKILFEVLDIMSPDLRGSGKNKPRKRRGHRGVARRSMPLSLTARPETSQSMCWRYSSSSVSNFRDSSLRDLEIPGKRRPPALQVGTRLSCPQGTSLGEPRLLARRCQGEHNTLQLEGAPAIRPRHPLRYQPICSSRRYLAVGSAGRQRKTDRCV